MTDFHDYWVMFAYVYVCIIAPIAGYFINKLVIHKKHGGKYCAVVMLVVEVVGIAAIKYLSMIY